VQQVDRRGWVGGVDARLYGSLDLGRVAAQTRPRRGDREAVDLRRLVAGFLRMAPDVAIVGEVRDKEALPELRAHDRAAA
jgi:hypothetical protein